MIFLNPDYLYMMLIPTLILFYFIVTNTSTLDRYFDAKILEKLRFENNTLGRVGRNILLFLALIMMIVALARPVHEKGEVQIRSKSIDIMVALDVSKSMMATDFYPSRLDFAKKRFVEFVDSFHEANIGVIAFSSEGFLVSPMTQDSTTLKYLVNNLTLDSMSLKGTNLRIPIEKGKAFLQDAKEKIVIIFTDGGDDESFEKEIALAKEYKESIYIYAVATAEGGPIKERGEAIKDSQGNIVITKLNEAIKQLAFESGGAYIEGNYEDDSITLMVEDIKKKFQMRAIKEKSVKEYQELFYYPLALAVLFLFFAFHSFPKRTPMVGLVLIMIVGFKQPVEAKVFDFMDIYKGKESYSTGAFEKAEGHFETVAGSNKTPESLYDLANAQYKQGKYKEALKNYERVEAKTEALRYKKAFNQGNAHFALEEYEKAVQAYEEAQKIDNEEDLEHNLALAKKKLEEKQQEEQEQKQNEDKDKEEQKEQDKQEQPQDKQKQESDNQKEQAQQKQQSQEDKQDEKQVSKEAEKAEKREEISQKEEKMWQKHLERQKPKTMPMKLEMQPAERRMDEKPW